ncbi:TPA: hypothetical protein PEE30_002643 [Staphylococcus aureus]|nr:hypothetical protein [Staphylococcus aureus]
MTNTKEIIENKFSLAFEEIDLGEEYIKKDEDVIDEIIQDVLINEGFPQEANRGNTKVKIIIGAGKDGLEDWAENYIEKENVESLEEAQSIKDEDIINFIFDNIDFADVKIEIDEGVVEWYERNPDQEYLELLLEHDTQSLIFNHVHEIEEGELDAELVQEALIETMKIEGFYGEVNIADIEYEVNPYVNVSAGKLAEELIADVQQSEMEATEYLEREFTQYILRNRYYDIDILIIGETSDYI